MVDEVNSSHGDELTGGRMVDIRRDGDETETRRMWCFFSFFFFWVVGSGTAQSGSEVIRNTVMMMMFL